MAAMLKDCVLVAFLTGVFFPHIVTQVDFMELIGEFVLENLNSLVCSAGMLLVHQGLSSLSARRRERPSALNARGDHMNHLDQLNISLILIITTMLWLLASVTSQGLNMPVCSSLPSSLQTAPASLEMLACSQEVAPTHFDIYHKSIFY